MREPALWLDPRTEIGTALFIQVLPSGGAQIPQLNVELDRCVYRVPDQSWNLHESELLKLMYNWARRTRSCEVRRCIEHQLSCYEVFDRYLK